MQCATSIIIGLFV